MFYKNIDTDDDTIIIGRGTTLYRTLFLYDSEDNPYMLKSGEKIIFGVKKNPITDTDYLIKKELTPVDEINGGYPLILTADETNISEGEYVYDIGVQLADGSFQRKKRYSQNMQESLFPFLITASVTRKE